MEVYEIPLNKKQEWTGLYDDMFFCPVLDSNNKYVVSVDADYSKFPFYEDLLKCNKIQYLPKYINEEFIL